MTNAWMACSTNISIAAFRLSDLLSICARISTLEVRTINSNDNIMSLFLMSLILSPLWGGLESWRPKRRHHLCHIPEDKTSVFTSHDSFPQGERVLTILAQFNFEIIFGSLCQSFHCYLFLCHSDCWGGRKWGNGSTDGSASFLRSRGASASAGGSSRSLWLYPSRFHTQRSRSPRYWAKQACHRGGGLEEPFSCKSLHAFNPGK